MIPPTIVNGDKIFKNAKFLPIQSSISSMLFNKDILEALALFRVNTNLEVVAPVETDEMHEMNA